MLEKYIWNTVPVKNNSDRGFYEVHKTDCRHLPATENQKEIGDHECCSAAIATVLAIETTKRFGGCYHCCWPCHMRNS